ncbi:MAG: hypothetical protein AAB857_03490 [Patescibacteria group bacterium]
MKASYVFLTIGVVFAGVVFQTVGVVSGWANMLMIAGAILILYILQKIPQVKFNTASWIFLVWFLFSAGIGMTWKQIAEKAPLTSEAFSMRSEQADIIYAERSRPKALGELTAMSMFTDEAARARARAIVKEMNDKHVKFLNGSITKEEYDVYMAYFDMEAKKNKEWREKRSVEILSLDSNPHNKSWQEKLQNIGNTPGRIVMWGLVSILIVAMIVSAATGKVVIKKYAIGLVVLIGLAFLADSFIYGSLRNKISGKLSAPNTSASTLASSQTIHQIDINPYTNSRPLQVPPGAFLDVSTPGWHEFRFDSGEVLRVENGMVTRTKNGVVSKLNKFPSRLPSTKFYMRGENGTAIVKIN